MLVSFNKSVLDNIERVVGMTNDSERQGIGSSVIAMEQSLERIAVAASRGFHKVPIIHRLVAISMDGRDVSVLIHAHLGRSYTTVWQHDGGERPLAVHCP